MPKGLCDTTVGGGTAQPANASNAATRRYLVMSVIIGRLGIVSMSERAEMDKNHAKAA